MSRRNKSKICLKPLLGSSHSSGMCCRCSTEQPPGWSRAGSRISPGWSTAGSAFFFLEECYSVLPMDQPLLAQLEMKIPVFLEHRNGVSEDRKKKPFRWFPFLAMPADQKHWMWTQWGVMEKLPAALTNPFLYYYFVIHFLLVGSTTSSGDVEHVPACCWHHWDGRVRLIRSLHMLFPCSSV